MTLRFTDIDWREVLNEWCDEDLYYLEGIINEKLAARNAARLLRNELQEGE